MLDVELLQTPKTQTKFNYGMYEYLWHVLNNSQFATLILHILIKERGTVHREWWDQSRSTSKFKVSYAVKSQVQVQSKSDNGEVAKVAYRYQEPLQIKTVPGNNYYEVQRYNDSTSDTRKYKRSDLNLLL